MSESIAPDFERMLREALHPVEPPEDFGLRLEATLANITDLAAEELDAWELAAFKDPRNWKHAARPVAAAAIGGAAGAALVLVRVRQNHRKRKDGSSDALDYAEQTLRAVADETRKLLDR
jgi:hypothetical protein